ncbi:MAG: peptidylprolyl isomerase, partial [Planktomarina sp.]
AGLSGTARSLGSVGDKTVSISSYANAVNSEVRQVQQQIGRELTQAEIQTLGLGQTALSRVVNTRVLDDLATQMGLSVGDTHVRDQVVEVPAFIGLDGQFDRVAYAEVLRRNNLSEVEFETSLREDAARQILQQAVLTGVDMPDAYANTIVSFLVETRDFSWARIANTDLITGVPVAEEADLVAYHTENADEFTMPEAKQITYLWITPDMVVDQVEISDEALRAEYDERSNEFNPPARRLVERLIFLSDDDAQAALDAITAGEKSFEDAVADRGLQLQDVDLGDVQKAALDAAGDAVFALVEPGIVGPLQTDLGPALFRVNAILNSTSTTFEEAREQLFEEAAATQSEGLIADMVENVDDILASGATLEEVADETDLVLGQLDWFPGVSDGIANYTEFQTAANAITADDFAQLADLSDGGIFAIRLDAVAPSRLSPLDDVRDQVEAAWTAQAVRHELTGLANTIAPQVSVDAPLATFGLVENVEEDMSRSDFVENTPPSMVTRAFDLNVGETVVLDALDGVILLTVTAHHAADNTSEETQSLREILGSRINDAIAADIFAAFNQGARNNVDVEIDANTVRAVNTSLNSGQN